MFFSPDEKNSDCIDSSDSIFNIKHPQNQMRFIKSSLPFSRWEPIMVGTKSVVYFEVQLINLSDSADFVLGVCSMFENVLIKSFINRYS